MHPSTRRLLLVGLLVLAGCDRGPFREVRVSFEAPAVVQTARPGSAHRFRISVAGMESPSGIYAGYSRLFGEVAQRMGYEVDFVQRRTYAEVNDLLSKGGLDAALLCTGGYLELQRDAPHAVELIGVPLINASATYQSLVIVPAASRAQTLDDLAGADFAFTDELSLTGRTWVVRELARAGRTPATFFASTLLTHSHDRSIAAVSRGVVGGAAVHSVVFQHLIDRDPTLEQKIRVIGRSPAFGLTPVVASQRLLPEVRAQLREVLVGLSKDPEGVALLEAAQIDGFAVPAPGLYDSAAEVVGASH